MKNFLQSLVYSCSPVLNFDKAMLASDLASSLWQDQTVFLKSNPHTPHPALGIDYGDARIGIAATDDFGILAHPVETIDRAKTDPISRIAELVERRKIRTLVVGLPIRMDGSEGESAAKVRAFAALLSERIPGVPIVFVDESLTTSAASAKLREAGRKARQQKAVIDQAAAVEILNAWMGD
jgi:putative holliday junction resolvase